MIIIVSLPSPLPPPPSIDDTVGGFNSRPPDITVLQVTVFNGDEAIQGCPMFIRAMPEVSEIKHSGMEPCAVGSIVEVQASFRFLFDRLPVYISTFVLFVRACV